MNLRRKDDEQEERPRGWRFDPTFRVSDVITVTIALGGAFAAYSSMDKRVALVEQSNQAVQSTVNEIRQDVKTLQRTVDSSTRRQP